MGLLLPSLTGMYMRQRKKERNRLGISIQEITFGIKVLERRAENHSPLLSISCE